MTTFNEKKNFAIGITERGDAGIDFDWQHKIQDVDGAILITKNLNYSFVGLLKAAARKKPIILHATITGWGGSALEPNVPNYKESLDELCELIHTGFPVSRCVLRIDPIIPTEHGVNLADAVLQNALSRSELKGIRVRISILDEYPHVKERLRKEGFAPFYEGTRFQPNENEIARVFSLLDKWHKKEGVFFETCAEPRLFGDCIIKRGCVSQKDLELMGLEMPDNLETNPQNRYGCLCLSCKKELLSRKHRCPHRCLYCYWKD